MKPLVPVLGLSLFLSLATRAQDAAPLPGTKPLTTPGDLSAQMVAGIDKFLLREIARAAVGRTHFWKRDFTSREAYEKSVAPNRERLRKIIGAVDERLPVKALEFVSDTSRPASISGVWSASGIATMRARGAGVAPGLGCSQRPSPWTLLNTGHRTA